MSASLNGRKQRKSEVNPRIPENSIPVTTFVEPPRYGEISAEIHSMELAEELGSARRQLSPLAYMVQVMNDETATPDRRDRMAIQAAALMCKQAEHQTRVKRGGPQEKQLGKKAARQARANKAATEGIFAVPSAPRQLVAQGDIRRSGF